MNNLTIIVDTWYLAYRCLFISKGFDKNKYNEEVKFLDSSDDIITLVNRMVSDLTYSLNTFKGYKRVICVSDSKSWRKDIILKTKSQYKSNRKKSDDVNWENFYSCIEQFLSVMEDNNVIVSNIDRAEGDDLIYLWSEYILNKENPDNVIILSGDGDISQVTDFNDNVFSIVFDTMRKNNTLIAKTGFQEWLSNKKSPEIDIFNVYDIDRLVNKDGVEIVKELTLDCKSPLEIKEVDPSNIIFNKIICGDDGDNIPSIWTWRDKTAEGKTKHTRITNKHYNKLHETLVRRYDSIDINEVISNDTLRNRIRLTLQERSKTSIPLDKFIEKLDINITLVYLNRKIIPTDIVDSFDENKEKLYKKTKNKPISIDILKGTPYYKAKNNVDESIFND